jgi:chromosomal replication initiation ATPase DnaA
MQIDDNGEVIINKKYYFFKIADDVTKLVSLKTGVPVNSIKNNNREINIKQARQIIYFFLLPIAKFYGKSQQTVANYIANQDHATAYHGKKVIFDLLSTNSEVELESVISEVICELKKKPYLTEIIEQIEHEIKKNGTIFTK